MTGIDQSQNNDISILVLSCTSYKNLWDPFFYFLKKNWPDCPFPVFLGTDRYTDIYEYDDCDIQLIKTNIEPNSQNYISRVVDFLESIDTKYVILFQDDHLIDATMYTNEIFECSNFLEDRGDEYAGVRLHGTGADCGHGLAKFVVNNRVNINECDMGQRYLFSWMTTLWSVSILRDLLLSVGDGSTHHGEGHVTDLMRRRGKKMLAIAEDVENSIDDNMRADHRRIRNIVPFMNIGAVHNGIVLQYYMDWLEKENVPIGVYGKTNRIYADGDERYNDERYMALQRRLEKRVRR